MFYCKPGKPQNSRPHDARYDPPQGIAGLVCWLLYAIGIAVMVTGMAGAVGLVIARLL